MAQVTVSRSRELAPPAVPPRPDVEPAFKLYYFNIRTRGELIRMIFHAAHVEFADVRVNASSWEQMKKGTPFQTLPVLEVQGHQLGQSMSIARFLATEFGMRGDDIYEQGLVDSVAETADDLLSDYLKTVIEEHPHHKHDSKRRFLEEILPHTLRYLDNFKRKHSREYGYIVGGKLTYADLAVYNVLEQLVVSGTVDPKLLLQFNYTAELRKRMLSHGSLSRYFKSRPHTQI